MIVPRPAKPQPSVIEAIIFDFNGVICDDEMIHFQVLQKVLAEEGVKLTAEQYERDLLGIDDQECFRIALGIEDGEPGRVQSCSLLQRKSAYYFQEIGDHPPIFPGVADLVREAANLFPLAIASGARRSEVEFVLQRAGLFSQFQVIVAAGEVSKGKPTPDIFLHALYKLNQKRGGSAPLRADSTLVIEDSLPGIQAANLAGMGCLAVANSHPAKVLTSAHHKLPHLKISVSELLALFSS